MYFMLVARGSPGTGLCSPKVWFTTRHQVEDGERVLLAADADAIPQQLGEGPTPLAGAAARGRARSRWCPRARCMSGAPVRRPP
jgi:hypothetical protein